MVGARLPNSVDPTYLRKVSVLNCESGSFHEKFIFANNVKDILASFKFATRT